MLILHLKYPTKRSGQPGGSRNQTVTETVRLQMFFGDKTRLVTAFFHSFKHRDMDDASQMQREQREHLEW